MFGNDQPTPFDLKFRLAGIPVRVNPWFWIVMALIGSDLARDPQFGPLYLVLWIACGFVSILVHEMGHAVAFKLFGTRSEVSLYAMGGLARPLYPLRSPVQRIMVYLAGPGAGFGLLGLLIGSEFAFGWAGLDPLASALFTFLFVQNLVWGLFNLLPIWPLDGGQVCRELFALAKLRNPDSTVHIMSMFVAGILAAIGVLSFMRIGMPEIPGAISRIVVGYLSRNIMMTFWMVLFAYTNYQMWQLTQRRGYYYEDENTPPWRRN